MLQSQNSANCLTAPHAISIREGDVRLSQEPNEERTRITRAGALTRFPAPSISHNPSFVPLGNVGGTTGNTGAASKGEAANPPLGQLPLFSLLRSSQSVLRGYLPSSASYILANGSQVPNSWNQRKSRSSRQHPQREASNFRLRRSQNALLLRPMAAHRAANERSAPAQVGGYGL